MKPANVLVDRNGNPVLGDFGLAKLLQQASVKTISGVTTGTPAYMSPEQVMGATVGPAADTYALTTMAYEFLAGTIPFEGEGMLELHYAHVHREPPPASSRNPELSPAVDAVLARGLAKDPASRWESGGALVGALAEALAPPPPIEATVPLPTPSRAVPDYVLPAGGAAQVTPAPAPRRGGRRPRRRPPSGRPGGRFAPPSLGDTVGVDGGPGGSLTADFAGFRAGQSVDVYLGTNARLGTVRADSQGQAVYELIVPRLLAVGQHQIRGCVGTVCVQSAFTVRRAG